jgi:hypothetical protein
VDLLVIMETEASPTERYVTVSLLLWPRQFPVDIIVKRPDELQHALENGDFFSVLEGYDVVFRSVFMNHYRQYLGYALWYYNGFNFPVLQCVWPDRYARFPWDNEFPEAIRWRQPVLWD